MTNSGLPLSVLPGTFAICRLGAEAPIPTWIEGDFLAITRTVDELSIVCPAACVPEEVQQEGGWRCLKVRGPLDFALTGVLASLAGPLAEAEISLFAISTYETDYVLVREADLQKAIKVLLQAGHHFSDER